MSSETTEQAAKRIADALDQKIAMKAERAAADKARSDHTPGPWEYESQDPHALGKITSDDGTLVAEVHGDWDDDHSTEANARLIAAAPDLLAACKLAVERLEVCSYQGDEDSFVEEIAAAIARAEGGGE
jgi:hypothetical protein